MNPNFPAARLAVALLLSSCGANVAATPVDRGVVADETRSQVVLMEAEGGIAAVDAASGEIRWSSDAADLPVFVQGGRIAALRESERGVLAYAVIDATDGAVIASKFATLPTPARVLVDERLGEKFEVVPLDGNRFAWTYTSETVPGAFINDRVLGEDDRPAGPDTQRIVLSGVVTIDLATPGATVTTDANARASMPRAAIDTAEMPQLGGQRFLSAAGTHLVASERADAENYRWRVHTRSGSALGEIESPYAYLPFAVVDKTLVVATPLRLERLGDEVDISPLAVQAISLSSGEVRWRRPIRDTAYRGPFPH